MTATDSKPTKGFPCLTSTGVRAELLDGPAMCPLTASVRRSGLWGAFIPRGPGLCDCNIQTIRTQIQRLSEQNVEA